MTTGFDAEAPPAVSGIALTDGVLRWQPGPAKDLCYYRVFRNGKQIRSTIATQTAVEGGTAGEYSVIAVDQSLNASE